MRPVLDQRVVTHDDDTETADLYETGEMRVTRKTGNRYGIRYKEALALECAYLRSRLSS